MRAVSLPDVPYGATAVRPQWEDLPPTVRAAVEARLGAPVTAAAGAGGGFTRAFAAVLETGPGERVFVKAAPLTDPAAQWYAREATVTAALPDGVRAARPRWTFTEGGWFVLGLAAVDGHVPRLPWSATELEAALESWAAAAGALAVPAPGLLAAGLPTLAGIAREEFAWWTEIVAGREPMPPAPAWAAAHAGELATLERRLPGLAAGDGMLHGDLRVDNVLIDGTGRAWLCDWTWPCLGAPWFDALTLLVTAYASGLDADAYVARWQPPDDGVDAALAGLAGYWLVQAAHDDGGSPHRRQHHRFSGAQALAWLADRRGWTAAGSGRFGGSEACW